MLGATLSRHSRLGLWIHGPAGILSTTALARVPPGRPVRNGQEEEWKVFELHESRGAGGVKYMTSSVMGGTGLVIHAFTTRIGGVSRPPYDTLNMGLHVGDDPKSVIENRKRVAQALEVPFEAFVAGQQVHGHTVAVVRSEHAGAGCCDLETAVAGVDGLATGEVGVVLMGHYADCVPILLLDPAAPAVAVVHAGWRGTARGIAQSGCETLRKAFGGDPSGFLAAIGPCIGKCCYTVGEAVKDALVAGLGEETWNAVSEPCGSEPGNEGKKWRLDLAHVNRLQLEACGLRPENIDMAGICTSCRQDLFFSHRGSKGRTGRFAALIALAPKTV